MSKIRLIIAFSIFLAGCSSSPSEKDIELVINNALRDSCEIAKISKLEKIDSVERIINDNKYYEVKVKFNASLKYDNSDAWASKYKEYIERKKFYEEVYKKHLPLFQEIESSIVFTANDEIENLKKLLNEISHSLMIPSYKSEKFSEYEIGVDAKEKENNIYEIKRKINELTSVNKKKIDEEMRRLLNDYESELNSKASFLMKSEGNFIYHFIKDKSKEQFSEKYPKGCLYTPNETIMNLLKTIGYPSEESIGNGFNVDIEMTTFIRKTEKGWSF